MSLGLVAGVADAEFGACRVAGGDHGAAGGPGHLRALLFTGGEAAMDFGYLIVKRSGCFTDLIALGPALHDDRVGGVGGKRKLDETICAFNSGSQGPVHVDATRQCCWRLRWTSGTTESFLRRRRFRLPVQPRRSSRVLRESTRRT